MTSKVSSLLLLAVLLFASGVRPEEDDQYFYDEEEEETISTHQPKFVSQPQNFSVDEGTNVSLPCRVDKLDGAVQIWKTADPSSGRTFFISSSRQYDDPRFRLEKAGTRGRSMMIDDVTPADSGTYECYISSNPAVSQRHTLDVRSAPVVTTSPKDGDLVVQEGEHVVLACNAQGNPQPTVSWTKKGGLLPYGEKKHIGETLDIAAVQSDHAGVYSCTADNEVGSPVVRHWTLVVNFAPRVSVTSGMVHTGAGHPAEMSCKVQGQPDPEVSWYRVKGSALDPERYERLQKDGTYSLKIAAVEDDDLGVYNCQATNSLGKATGIVHLTGKPEAVLVTSAPNGDQKEGYTLKWSVKSYSPLLQYKVLYRPVQETGEPELEWKEKIASLSSATAEDGMLFNQSTTLEGLQSASIYEAIVTASNTHGWSQTDDELFRFSTLGAKALKSTDPSSALSLRSGLMTSLVALLLPLLVIL